MLPDFRFIIGAALATALLGMTGLGLFTATRLAHHAKLSPLEASRSLAFADPSERNPFYDPETARRFDDLARKATAADAAPGVEVTPATANLPAVIALEPAAMPERNDAPEQAAAAVTPAPQERAAAVETPPPGDLLPSMTALPTPESLEPPAAGATITMVPQATPDATPPMALAAPPAQTAPPIELATPTTPPAVDQRGTIDAAAAASILQQEPAETGSVALKPEPTPPGITEQIAAVPPTAAALQTTPKAEQATVQPAAPATLPSAAVTVHPVHRAAPVKRALAAPARTARVRAETQQYQQRQQSYAQPLTGFEWAGHYAKPQAAETYAGYHSWQPPAAQSYAPQAYQQPYGTQSRPTQQQQYAAQPFAQQQAAQPYRTQQYREQPAQPYRAQQYPRDPYVNNQWRPWSELSQSNR